MFTKRQKNNKINEDRMTSLKIIKKLIIEYNDKYKDKTKTNLFLGGHIIKAPENEHEVVFLYSELMYCDMVVNKCDDMEEMIIQKNRWGMSGIYKLNNRG